MRETAGGCKVPLGKSPEGGHSGSEYHPNRRKRQEVDWSPVKEALISRKSGIGYWDPRHGKTGDSRERHPVRRSSADVPA